MPDLDLEGAAEYVLKQRSPPFDLAAFEEKVTAAVEDQLPLSLLLNERRRREAAGMGGIHGICQAQQGDQPAQNKLLLAGDPLERAALGEEVAPAVITDQVGNHAPLILGQAEGGG